MKAAFRQTAALAAVLVCGNALAAAPPTVTPAPPPPAAVSATLSAEHYVGFRTDSSPRTDLTADVIYRPGGRHRLRVIQGVSKNYSIPEIGGREVDVADTILYHYYRLSPEKSDWTLNLRSGATIPVSSTSQTYGLITAPSVTLDGTRKLLNDKLTVSIRPTVKYHWYRYTSTPDGNPVKQWTFSALALGDYAFNDKWGVTAVVSYGLSRNRQSPYAAQAPPTSDTFSLDAYVTHTFSPLLAARAGYSHSDPVHKEGRNELTIYDVNSSTAFLAVDLNL